MCSDRRGLSLALAAALALAAGAACSGPGAPAELEVTVAGITPACVDAGTVGHVVISGALPVRPSTSLSGGGTTVDSTYRASVGDHELANVTWKDGSTLDADVPADVPAGRYALVVQSPFGTTATVPDLFQVGACGASGPSLSITTATVTPNTVTVGQDVTVTATVRNGGTAAAHGVVGALTLPATGFTASPISVGPKDLDPGASVDFSWTVHTAAVTPVPGVTFAVDAAGTDGAGAKVAAPQKITGDVLVNSPASLAASAATSAPTVNVGQDVTFTVTVTNSGATGATVTALATATASPPGVTITRGGAAQQQHDIAGGASFAFAWTFHASAPCTMTLNVSLSSSVAVAPVAPVEVAVVQSAALAITAGVAPAAVAPGASVTVTATVQNSGGAAATGVTASVTAAPAGFTFDATRSSVAPRDVAAGASSPFTFVYVAGAGVSGGSFAIAAAGTDANTRAPVNASPVSSPTVLVTYAIGGNASGLTGPLVLTNTDTTTNASEDHTVAASGGFTFPTRIPSGHGYHVTVKAAPPGQTCGVTGGSGTVGTADVGTVAVACSTNAMPLSTGYAGNGAGTLQCNGAACAASYDYGTSVAVAATPATGSTFAGWSGDCSGTAPCNVTMTASRVVTATFMLVPVALSTTVTGNGSVSCNNLPCAASYDYGTSVTVTATPGTGAIFDGWSGDCSGKGTCTVTMTTSHVVTATFTP